MRTDRKGQALMELAVGMLALALVVAALCGFAEYIAKSLKVQNSLRVGGKTQDSIQVGEFASKNIFGRATIRIKERFSMPSNVILK